MKYRFFSACVVACALAAVVACGKSNPASPSDGSGGTAVTNPGGSAGTGKLRVSMKDGPFLEAKAVLVTISEISIHMAGDSWQPLTAESGTTLTFPTTCNLTSLTNVSQLLGVTTLPEGHYTQIRLTVTEARAYFDKAPVMATPCIAAFPPATPAVLDDDEGTPLNIPSGVIKINHQFTIGAGATTDMLLDFDGDKSIHKTGNDKYMMSPVISVVATTTTPTVTP